MKLLRYGPLGQEQTGLLDDDGQVRDLSALIPDLGGAALSRLSALQDLDPSALPLVGTPGRIGACLSHVPNFHCVGLNYAKHADEAGLPRPTEPVLFSKATSCLSGPYDPVVIPQGCVKADWEVELGIVIGADAHNVSEEDAMEHVAGYCIVNDVSERSFQMDHGGQWTKGKSAPTFGPTGPWLVTKDEIPDPQVLALSTDVNGERMQDSSTADMVFPVRQIVSYISRFMRLVPGDLIATGTPQGVGMGWTPQRFLKPGDVMELRIEGLGHQRVDVIAAQ